MSRVIRLVGMEGDEAVDKVVEFFGDDLFYNGFEQCAVLHICILLNTAREKRGTDCRIAHLFPLGNAMDFFFHISGDLRGIRDQLLASLVVCIMAIWLLCGVTSGGHTAFILPTAMMTKKYFSCRVH